MAKHVANLFKLKWLDDLERAYHEAVLAQVTADPLTGLSNRLSVLGFLGKQADLSRRYRRPLAIILCDLDHFKAVNDAHGHAAGDQALRVFGAVLERRLRACDVVGRIGGEEFLAVLPETRGREALVAAEDLRTAVAAEPVPVGNGQEIRITCCFGVVDRTDADADAAAMLARADMALYRAKAAGRNRVEFDGLP